MRSPGEQAYPDEMLDAVQVTEEARLLAEVLHHEAQTRRILGILQVALTRARLQAFRDAADALAQTGAHKEGFRAYMEGGREKDYLPVDVAVECVARLGE